MLDRSKLVSLSETAKSLGLGEVLVRYNPAYYFHARRVISQFMAAGESDRARLSEKLLSRVINRARGTEYGRPYGADLGAWPILKKEELRSNISRFEARSVVRVPASTGGTTGKPIKLWRSLQSIAAEQAFRDSIVSRKSQSFLFSRVAVLRADFVKDADDDEPPFGVYRNMRKRLVLSNTHLSKNTIEWFVLELKRFKPDILWAYPSMVANLARLLSVASLDLEIPYVLTSSELMTVDTRTAIKRTLSAEVIDYYGQGERVCFAYSDRLNEYWFNPAYGYVELIPKTEAVGNGEYKEVDIVATGYWNDVLPLIRYHTGDSAIVPRDASKRDLRDISLGLKPFHGIAGRYNEYLTSPDGKIIGGLNHIPREVDHVIRIQIVQHRPTLVTINVLCEEGFTAEDQEMLLSNARELIPDSVDLKVKKVTKLLVNKNQKAPFVIREAGSE